MQISPVAHVWRWCCMLVLLVTATTALAQPLAHWRMEAISNGVIPDVTGNGYDASAHGKKGVLPEPIGGIVGGALQFDEDRQQYLVVEKLEGLATPDQLTVMAWIRPARRNGTYEILCGKGDRSGDPPWPGWRFRYFWTRVVFQFGTADGREPSASSAEWSVEPRYWTHVAAAWDSDRLAIFVNGVRVAQERYNAEIMASRRKLIIGNYIGRKNAYAFVGAIDELKVCDRALTEHEGFEAAIEGMPE